MAYLVSLLGGRMSLRFKTGVNIVNNCPIRRNVLKNVPCIKFCPDVLIFVPKTQNVLIIVVFSPAVCGLPIGWASSSSNR